MPLVQEASPGALLGMGGRCGGRRVTRRLQYKVRQAEREAKSEAKRQEKVAKHNAAFAATVAEGGVVRAEGEGGAVPADSSKTSRAHSRGASDADGTSVMKRLKGTETPLGTTPSAPGQMDHEASVDQRAPGAPITNKNATSANDHSKEPVTAARALVFTTPTSDKGKEEASDDLSEPRPGASGNKPRCGLGDKSSSGSGRGPGGDQGMQEVLDGESSSESSSESDARANREIAEAATKLEMLKAEAKARKKARKARKARKEAGVSDVSRPVENGQTLVEIKPRGDIAPGELVAFRSKSYLKRVAGVVQECVDGLYFVSSAPGKNVIVLQKRHITRLGFRSNRVAFRVTAAPNRQPMRVLADNVVGLREGFDTVYRLVYPLYTITDAIGANAAPIVVGLMTAAIAQHKEHRRQRITMEDYKFLYDFDQDVLLPVSLLPVAVGDSVIVQIPRGKTRYGAEWYDVCWRATVTDIDGDEVVVTYPKASRRLGLPTILPKSHVMGVPPHAE